MMLKYCAKTIAIGLLGLFTLPSCERGELLNSEADILEVHFPAMPDSLKVGEPRITNSRVRVPHLANTPGTEAELHERLLTLQPSFVLTPGATIQNVSHDSVRDNFNYPQYYLVTSEDRQWSKQYEFTFFRNLFYKTQFSFEHFETYSDKQPYHIFFEMDDELGKQEVWSSGNAGFAITAGKAPGEDYPTAKTDLGYKGKGVRLVTRSTGKLGASIGKPIAAGNLFLGNFDMHYAMLAPLQATKFGVPTVMDEPLTLTLRAKYKAGPEYKDAQGNKIETVDRPEIYAVLYEPKPDEKGFPIQLDGTNVKTADNIIAIAEMTAEQAETLRVADVDAPGQYTLLTIPFVSRKPFDHTKQTKGAYNIALVFSSSAKGAAFEGAIGSTLYIDEVQFITK